MGQTIEPNLRTERSGRVWGHWLSMPKALDLMGEGVPSQERNTQPQEKRKLTQWRQLTEEEHP